MKQEILQKIEMTKESLKTTLDSFITDHLTSCFNEFFLHEYLLNHLTLQEHQKEKTNLVLVYLKIDNIIDINVKYSNTTGDETISNLAYIIKQAHSDNDLLFKLQGPNFILLLHDHKEGSLKEYASVIQNSVRKSEAFIEPITISAAVVTLDEISDVLPKEDRIKKLIAYGKQRINLSHELGNNAFIDQHTIIEKTVFGKILIVDSDPLTLSIMKTFYEKNHYQVQTAIDGLLALSILKTENFDAIIADRYTHKIDGFTLKDHLNDSTINMNTLYLLTVQNKDVDIVLKSNLVGVNYIFDKPIIFEEILGVIRREINRKECTKS